MSQTSQTIPQTSPQLTTPQNMQREMLTKLLWCGVIALVLVVIFAIVPSIITAITYIRSSGTASPGSTLTASQVQELSSKADQQLQQASSLLNLITSFATVMGVVLAVFAIVTIGLGTLGFFTNNGFRDLEEKWRKGLESVGALQEKTEDKGKAIDKLQEDMRQKQEYIDRLHEEARQKQQNIDDLQQRLNTLRETMESEVAAIETQFENTNTALTLLILGNQLLEQRQREQAVEVFEKAQKLRPKDPQINYALGRACSGLGAFDKAIYYLGLATDVDRNFPQAHMELGLAYRRQGNRLYEEAVLEANQEKKRELNAGARADYEEAIKHLARAIELRTDYEDTLATLGGLYRRLGDYEHDAASYRQALEYYEKASKAEPNSSYALGNVASLAWYFGRREEALRAFTRNKEIAQERIAKLARPAEVYWDYYDLALAQLALGQIEEAKETYAKAIERTPGLVDFDGVLSNLHLLQKATERIEGLDEIIKMVEDAKIRQGKK